MSVQLGFRATAYDPSDIAAGLGFSPGDVVTTHDGKQFVFVKAGGALNAGDLVTFDGSYNASQVSTANAVRGSRVGILVTALSSGQYGWAQTMGVASAKTAGAVAASARLNTTATAGSIDDDGSVGAFVILGASSVGSVGGAGTVSVMLAHPVIAHIAL